MYVNNVYIYISLYLHTIIRFYSEYIYSGCDCAPSYSNGSVCPRLNYFIRTLKRCSVFISLFFSDQEFISNAEILIDLCGVFAIYGFFYMRLFPLTYVSAIRYMIYLEDHVL